MIKLDSNEAPRELPPELKALALARLGALNWARYPHSDAEPLRARLSSLYGWPQEQVVVGNGSDELLQAIFIGLREQFDKVIIPTPTFSMYKILAQRFGKDVREVSSRGRTFVPDIKQIKMEAKDPRSLLFICQPNNPTGRAWSGEEIGDITETSQAIVVIDQAYGEFCPRVVTLPEGPRTIVLRTFSKAMAAAGLRLGYALSPSDIAESLRSAMLPYNVNVLSQTLALFYLEQQELAEKQVAEVLSSREQLFSQLERLGQIEPLPSEANFILARVANAHTVREALSRRGISVRCFADEMLTDYLRITVGLPQENAQLVAALREVLEERQWLSGNE